jgi:hypothetical protein
MTNGMKSGAGSDPFADADTETDEESSEADATDVEDAVSEPAEGETTAATERDVDSDETAPPAEADPAADESLPYLFDRDGVKDNREMVQYFLQDTTVELETQSQRAVEDELGTDVYLTDLREALVRVGAEHLDEVADELREWGYRFQEE